MFGDKSIINLKPAAAHGERTGLRIPTYPCCIILRYQIRRIITAPAFIVHQSSDFSFVLSLRMHGVRHLLLLEYHVAGTIATCCTLHLHHRRPHNLLLPRCCLNLQYLLAPHLWDMKWHKDELDRCTGRCIFGQPRHFGSIILQ